MSTPETIPDLRVDIHRRHSWAFRYLLDWGGCGKEPSTIRAYATILRWYSNPTTRHRMMAHFRAWYGYPPENFPEILRSNLDQLLDLEVRIGPGYPAGRFGHFLRSMYDGDIVRGGPVSADTPPELVTHRPGFAFLFSRWLFWLNDYPCPWSWHHWPRPHEIEP